MRVSNKTDDPVAVQLIGSGAAAGAGAETPGESHIGQVGGSTVVVSANPVLTVAATYVANDYVGTSGVAIVFTNVARLAAGSGIIMPSVLVDAALQSISTELWLFDAAVTPPADSAAWSISDADAAKLVAVLPFSTYYASALNSVSISSAQPIPFVCAAADRNLYGCLVTRGAPAYASLNLTVKLKALQD